MKHPLLTVPLGLALLAASSAAATTQTYQATAGPIQQVATPMPVPSALPSTAPTPLGSPSPTPTP